MNPDRNNEMDNLMQEIEDPLEIHDEPLVYNREDFVEIDHYSSANYGEEPVDMDLQLFIHNSEVHSYTNLPSMSKSFLSFPLLLELSSDNMR